MRILRTPFTTLMAAFLHFDTCFALWVLLGALGIFIAQNLKLSPAEQGFLVAVPTLGGSLARFPMGILGDRFGYKRMGTILLFFLFLPLLAGWLLPLNFPALLAVGLLLGCAGSSFAVALPLASRCYPAERQGLVMGITAAGNMGTVIANLAAPALARSYGWHVVMGLAMIPLALVLLIFVTLSREAEKAPASTVSLSQSSGSIFKSADLWWFAFFYSITFGGFVGLSTFLPLFLHNQYGLSAVSAGLLTAFASLAGSLARPLGGFLADRLGGIFMLNIVFSLVAISYALLACVPPLGLGAALILFLLAMLGTGNGAVFQLVPLRFPQQIGMATGFVGACGGLGGFLLPSLLGEARQLSGGYATGLISLALLALGALVSLRLLVSLRPDWQLGQHAAAPVGRPTTYSGGRGGS
ncbi:MAG: NarK/NasA family nitrate transporter [Thermogemmatispora sp.]|jgi:NNP family nitrate/nitrite transporter-like MFS transporter|uniref:MFS transporter n=1 Tax=Thermogemmatispora sp. TaxID=1968838 RepID=UPI001A0A7F42|nr:MFS transporter [Thermogemmatispora sp.]MBE3564289.1 NarK/NasA family nitrate transporter [Thermogemmatispora sp.]